MERGANLEAKDEDGAIPLHDACAGGKNKNLSPSTCSEFFPRKIIKTSVELFFFAPSLPLFSAAGFTEIAQLLLNTASSAERVKRMLEAVDDEGDTVSSNNKLNGFRVLVGGRILRADWKLVRRRK